MDQNQSSLFEDDGRSQLKDIHTTQQNLKDSRDLIYNEYNDNYIIREGKKRGNIFNQQQSQDFIKKYEFQDMCVPENEDITKECDNENPRKNRESQFINLGKCQNSPYAQNYSHVNTNQNIIFYGQKDNRDLIDKSSQKNQLNNFRKVSIIMPEGRVYIIWQIIVFFMIGLQLLFIPVKVAFKITDLAKGPIEFFLFGNFALIIFSFDILLCFNVARYEKGILTIDRIEIAKHYLKKEFLFDLISTISILLVILYQSNVYEMPFVIRGFQIKERLAKLDQYFQIKEKFPIIYEISLIIIAILVMAHISGCGFYFIGNYDKYYGKVSWIVFFDLEDKLLIEQYITSIYFTFISMITVGYGDLYPITVNEKFYVIIMTLFSCGIFGYCINRLGSLVSLIQEQSKELESQRKIIKDYLKSRNISHQVQCKFLKNLEYKKKLKYGNDIETQQLINKQIDPLIQKEFQVEYYGRIIKKTMAFSFNFSQSSINDLSLVAKEQIYTAGDILFNQGQQIDNLYILMKGELEFGNFENFQENIKFNFKMQKEQCISLNGFLAGQHYITSAVFASESRVISISKKDFLKVIKKQDRDYEMYCQMRDRIIFSKSYWQQAETCTSCKTNKSHDSKFCPQLHVKQNKALILQGYCKQENNNRCSFQRRMINLKQNCLINNLKNRENARRIRIQTNEILRGVEFNQYDENLYINQTISDKEFVNIVPKIRNNFVPIQLYQQVEQKISILKNLYFQIEQHNLEQNNSEIDQLIEEINELYSQEQSDESERDDISIEKDSLISSQNEGSFTKSNSQINEGQFNKHEIQYQNQNQRKKIMQKKDIQQQFGVKTKESKLNLMAQSFLKMKCQRKSIFESPYLQNQHLLQFTDQQQQNSNSNTMRSKILMDNINSDMNNNQSAFENQQCIRNQIRNLSKNNLHNYYNNNQIYQPNMIISHGIQQNQNSNQLIQNNQYVNKISSWNQFHASDGMHLQSNSNQINQNNSKNNFNQRYTKYDDVVKYFDKMKKYQWYKPYNNISMVLKKLDNKFKKKANPLKKLINYQSKGNLSKFLKSQN